MNRTTLALAVTIPALCMGAVNAQTTNIPLPPAVLACAEETDVLRRLACFDREVARLRDVPESVPEPAPEPTVAAPGTRANPEEETERRRAEAERKLLEELERQRAENVRLRREAEAAEMHRRQQQEIETEQRRIEAVTSPQSNIESSPAAAHAKASAVPDDVGTRDQSPDEFSATVNDIAHRAYGEMIILLDNGQIWEQKHRDTRFRLKVGDSVTISKGLISGYRLRSAGRNHSIQVERFK